MTKAVETGKFAGSEIRALLFAYFSVILGLMAIDFFNPSLPMMQKDLAVSQSAMKNLIVFYMIVLGLGQFIYGSLSDARGRKVALTSGFGVAVLGLLVGYFAHDIVVLDISRVLTALGTASCNVIARALIVDTVQRPDKLRRAFSYFTMTSQLSPALAPLVGAFVGVRFGWNVQFLLLAVAMFAGLLMIAFLMPETHPAQARTRGGAGTIQTYLAVLKNLNFMCYSVAAALILCFTIAFYATAPFAFHALGVGPLGNSLFYILYSLSIISGSFLNGRLRRPAGETYRIGLAAYVVLFAVAAVVGLDSSPVKIALFAAALGFTCGLTAPLALTLSMSTVQTARGAVSAVQGAITILPTGLLLMVFDSVVITGFGPIVLIFLGFAAALVALYVLVSVSRS